MVFGGNGATKRNAMEHHRRAKTGDETYKEDEAKQKIVGTIKIMPKRTLFLLAERTGFEPAVPCGTHAFQACSFNHSDTSPRRSNRYN